MSDDRIELTWVNHASFLLRCGTVGLLCDPWLSGTAFDRGWAHHSPTHAPPELLDATTHLWFSHEHPDHFSPPSLRAIDADRRGDITVLYQPTVERKVLDHCGSLGFRTHETDGGWQRLSPSLEVAVLPWTSGDSILAARTPDTVLLNANDAVIRSDTAMRTVLDRLGIDRVDVLMTQFSYANWEGNPDDVARRRAAAATKLDALVVQAEVAKPAVVVPFASFVWFCHVENEFMNDAPNSVATAVEAIVQRTSAQPVVLYPGDRWTVGDPHEPGAAVDRYRDDVARTLATAPREPSIDVELDELREIAAAFLATLRRINGERTVAALGRLGILGPATVWLDDHDVAVVLDLDGLRVDRAQIRERCDFAGHSGAIAFALRHLYGGATLNVNGRFTVPPDGDARRLRRYLQISNLNNQGISVLGAGPEIARKARDVIEPRLSSLLARARRRR